MADNEEVNLMDQTRHRQRYALIFDIVALIIFFFVADRIELMDQSAAPVLFLVFLIKVYFRFVTEREIVGQHKLYLALREIVDDTGRLENGADNTVLNFVFEVSFAIGTVFLYLTTIMMVWWITAIRICLQIAPMELFTRAALLCVALWLLFEIPSLSMPYLMPWFRTSRLIVSYKLFFGLLISRPKGHQRMYPSRNWAFRMLVLASIVTVCFLAQGVCASVLVPFISSTYLGLLLFRTDVIRSALTFPQNRRRDN